MTEAAETILIIEDDASIREGLQLNLRIEGYEVLAAADARRGLELAREAGPDLILLDLMLPDGSGLDLLGILRREEREMQVLILTARGLESDKIRGLKLGADDYITKPFALAELLARIEASLRRERVRRHRSQRDQISFGAVTIDQGSRTVVLHDEQQRLTTREYELLVHLALHPDRVYSREQLLAALWGQDYQGTTRTVDNFISNLRNKLELDPSRPAHIRTVHGVGYKLTR